MDILKVAILEKCRQNKSNSFSPLIVIQSMYPVDWKYFSNEVYQKAWELYLLGHVKLVQNGKELSKSSFPKEDFQIAKIN